MLRKVISGGQTGVDQLGLEVARQLGLETGGTAPRYFMTENGSNYNLRDVYGLVESTSPEYNPRTEQNVIDADATVIFGNPTSVGSKLTARLIKKYSKPSKVNPTVEELKMFIKENNVTVLNVAGNRGSKLTSSEITRIQNILKEALL